MNRFPGASTMPPLPPPSLPDAVDVLVIGAGPAGSVAARQAALQGWRVLLVEKRRFPREKVCGGCLNPLALDRLAVAGLDNLHEAAALRRLVLRAGGAPLSIRLGECRAVLRSEWDQALANAAVLAGAKFIERHEARVAPPSAAGENSRNVWLTTTGEPPVRVRAGVVLVADGLTRSSLAEWPEFAVTPERGSRIGLGAVLDEGLVPPGDVRMAIGRRGYAGLVRLPDGRTNVAAAVDADLLRHAGPSGAVAACLQEAGWDAALPDADWHGTPPLTRAAHRVAAERVLLLGDAVGYVEPFTGEGMAWAIDDAVAAIPFVKAGLAHWTPELAAAWTARRDGGRRRRQGWCRLWAWILRRPRLATASVAAFRHAPRLAEFLLNRVQRVPARRGGGQEFTPTHPVRPPTAYAGIAQRIS